MKLGLLKARLKHIDDIYGMTPGEHVTFYLVIAMSQHASGHLVVDAADNRHVLPEIEIDRYVPAPNQLHHEVIEFLVQLLQPLLDFNAQRSRIERFQRRGMNADIAEHEFSSEQSHFEIGDIAKFGQHRGLPHVRQDQPDAGSCGGYRGYVEVIAELLQREDSAVDPASGSVDSDVLSHPAP